MKTVTLTEEQAAWLKSHLESIAAKRPWQEGERIEDQHFFCPVCKANRDYLDT